AAPRQIAPACRASGPLSRPNRTVVGLVVTGAGTTQRDGGGVPTVRTEAVVGFGVQLAVLAVLARTVGLGSAGSLAGIGYGLVVLALLRRCRLGPADRVTLARATLIRGVTALVARSVARPRP